MSILLANISKICVPNLKFGAIFVFLTCKIYFNQYVNIKVKYAGFNEQSWCTSNISRENT